MRLHTVFVTFLALAKPLESKFAPRTETTILPTPITSSSNSIISNCCFIIQDTISEYYWDIYTSVGPIYREIHVTSITTLVTPFADTVVTRYETNIQATFGGWFINTTIAQNSAALAFGQGPQPLERASELKSGTQVITERLTIQSPTAFWIYSTVKVITVPPITNSAGHAVCVTRSSQIHTTPTPVYGNVTTHHTVTRIPPRHQPAPTGLSSQTFEVDGVNSNAEAYFGGQNIKSYIASIYLATTTGYGTESEYIETSISGSETFIEQDMTFPMGVWGTSFAWIRSNGETFTYTPSAIGNIISLPTPYVYIPSWATHHDIGGAKGLCTSFSNDYYGYVPQAVIDHLVLDPKIKREYPWLSSCLPGGPSVLHATCAPSALSTSSLNPQTQQPVQDLTSSTISTVYGWESSYALDASGRVISTYLKTTPSSVLTTPLTIPKIPEQLSPTTSSPPWSMPFAYLDFPTTTISGITYFRLSPTTIPLIPGLGIPGYTTVLSGGNTEIIITAPTQIPLPPSWPKFPKTVISSSTFLELSPTTNPFVPGLDIPGYTTVGSDGKTEIIISDSTQIPFISINGAASSPVIFNSAVSSLAASMANGPVWFFNFIAFISVCML